MIKIMISIVTGFEENQMKNFVQNQNYGPNYDHNDHVCSKGNPLRGYKKKKGC